MSRAEIYKMPIQDGDKSVLSGKDTIMGMPKTPAMRRTSGTRSTPRAVSQSIIPHPILLNIERSSVIPTKCVRPEPRLPPVDQARRS
jgi:hypothetical protein